MCQERSNSVTYTRDERANRRGGTFLDFGPRTVRCSRSPPAARHAVGHALFTWLVCPPELLQHLALFSPMHSQGPVKSWRARVLTGERSRVTPSRVGAIKHCGRRPLEIFRTLTLRPVPLRVRTARQQMPIACHPENSIILEHQIVQLYHFISVCGCNILINLLRFACAL
jgi:hypothetical protein